MMAALIETIHPAWLAFAIGGFLGTAAGVMIMCLCFVSGRGSECEGCPYVEAVEGKL